MCPSLLDYRPLVLFGQNMLWSHLFSLILLHPPPLAEILIFNIKKTEKRENLIWIWFLGVDLPSPCPKNVGGVFFFWTLPSLCILSPRSCSCWQPHYVFCHLKAVAAVLPLAVTLLKLLSFDTLISNCEEASWIWVTERMAQKID